MYLYPPTVVLRHRKENLKKCSLRGLESREDFHFYTYPKEILPQLNNYIVLSFDGPLLSKEDGERGLFILDATWKYAGKMYENSPEIHKLEHRSLPEQYRTAYPRIQNDCPDPSRGLASIEAIFVAYHLMGRSTEGLLDLYHWKKEFLEMNRKLFLI